MDYEEILQNKLRAGTVDDHDIREILDHGSASLKREMERKADALQRQKQYYERANHEKIDGFDQYGNPIKRLDMDPSMFGLNNNINKYAK